MESNNSVRHKVISIGKVECLEAPEILECVDNLDRRIGRTNPGKRVCERSRERYRGIGKGGESIELN